MVGLGDRAVVETTTRVPGLVRDRRRAVWWSVGGPRSRRLRGSPEEEVVSRRSPLVRRRGRLERDGRHRRVAVGEPALLGRGVALARDPVDGGREEDRADADLCRSSIDRVREKKRRRKGTGTTIATDASSAFFFFFFLKRDLSQAEHLQAFFASVPSADLALQFFFA